MSFDCMRPQCIFVTSHFFSMSFGIFDNFMCFFICSFYISYHILESIPDSVTGELVMAVKGYWHVGQWGFSDGRWWISQKRWLNSATGRKGYSFGNSVYIGRLYHFLISWLLVTEARGYQLPVMVRSCYEMYSLAIGAGNFSMNLLSVRSPWVEPHAGLT